jgi:hypothetical protein
VQLASEPTVCLAFLCRVTTEARILTGCPQILGEMGTLALDKACCESPFGLLIPPALPQPSPPTRTCTLRPHFASGRVTAGLGGHGIPLGI